MVYCALKVLINYNKVLQQGVFMTQNLRYGLVWDQKFFSFDDFTWSKELLDRLTFLKQNFCHKMPKVLKSLGIKKVNKSNEYC